MHSSAYFRASTSHNNKGNFEQQQSVEEALWSRPKPRFIVSPTKTLPPKQTCLRAFILLCLQPLVFPGVRELLPNTSSALKLNLMPWMPSRCPPAGSDCTNDMLKNLGFTMTSKKENGNTNDQDEIGDQICSFSLLNLLTFTFFSLRRGAWNLLTAPHHRVPASHLCLPPSLPLCRGQSCSGKKRNMLR